MQSRPKQRVVGALALCLGAACAQELELPLRAPLADAGDDQRRLFRPGGVVIGLDARASCDPEGERLIGFQWSLTSYPGDGRTSLEHASSLHPSFLAPVPGLYSVSLRVHTEDRVSEADEVLIELLDDLASDHPPVLPAHDLCGEPIE